MKLRNLFLTAVAAVTLAACGNQTSKQETTKETKPAEHVKVAVVGSAAHEIWDFVAEKAKKENIDLEVVEMNDYVLPNTALEEGSVQLNAFQHRAYLAQWNKDKGSDIKEIGTTFIVPLYYFSTKYKSLATVGAFKNKMFNIAIVVSVLMLLSVLVVPGLTTVFSVTVLNLEQWLVVLAAAFSIVPFVEIAKAIMRGMGLDKD